MLLSGVFCFMLWLTSFLSLIWLTSFLFLAFMLLLAILMLLSSCCWLTSVLIPVLLLCLGVSVVFSIHAAIDFSVVAGVLLLLTSLLIPVLILLLLFSLLLSLWMVSLPFSEFMLSCVVLLLPGSSVVDIPSISGVSTFVGDHSVVVSLLCGPAVVLVFMLLLGFLLLFGVLMLLKSLNMKTVFPPKMTSFQFVPSKCSWQLFILRRWQTDQICHCCRCYRW